MKGSERQAEAWPADSSHAMPPSVIPDGCYLLSCLPSIIPDASDSMLTKGQAWFLGPEIWTTIIPMSLRVE